MEMLSFILSISVTTVCRDAGSSAPFLFRFRTPLIYDA